MATKPLSKRLSAAINKLIKAEDADSFKGCGDPGDYQLIEDRLHRARQNLANLLKEVETLEDSKP